jgi:hypothetical protein
MNRILAIVSSLALAGIAFAGEPAKTDAPPAKTEASAPAKTDTKAPVKDSKGTKGSKDSKAPKGRRGQVGGVGTQVK